MAVNKIDDEEMKVRSLQGTYQNAPISPLIKHTETPSGISSVSSIESAGKKDPVFLQRPILPAPKHTLIDVIQVYRNTEKLDNKRAQIVDAELMKHLASTEKLDEERLDTLENEAKAVKSKNTWSTLANVSEYITGIGSIIVGSSVAGPTSALLIGAGVLGLGARINKDIHFIENVSSWLFQSHETQQKIAYVIETGAFYLQMGLTLAGGAYGWYSGAFSQAPAALNLAQKSAAHIATVGTIAGVGATVGTEFYKNKIADFQARIKEISAGITLNQQAITQETQSISKMLDASTAESDEIRKAVQALQITLD